MGATGSVRRRLVLNTIALTINKFVSSGYLFLSVPVMLAAWGPQVYGEWLILIAFPSQFAILANLGLASHSSNRMASQIAAGNTFRASIIFQNAHSAITLLSLMFSSGVWLVFARLNVTSWLNISHIAGHTHLILALTFLNLLLRQQMGMLMAAIRASGNYHRVANLFSAESLLTLLVGVFIGIWYLRWPPHYFAVFTVFLTIIQAVVTAWFATKWCSFAKPGVRLVRFRSLFRLTKESVGYTYIPLIESMGNQTLNIVIGAFTSPIHVGQFSTLRILSSAIRQVASVLINSFEPELAMSVGKRSIKQIRQLHRTLMTVSFVTSLGLLVFVVAIAPWLYTVWTRGQYVFLPFVFVTLCFSCLFHALWLASARLLIVKGEFAFIAIPYALLIASSAGVAMLFVSRFGFWPLSLALCMTHAILLTKFAQRSLQISQDSVAGITRFISKRTIETTAELTTQPRKIWARIFAGS